jgi:hypothetical protein
VQSRPDLAQSIEQYQTLSWNTGENGSRCEQATDG